MMSWQLRRQMVAIVFVTIVAAVLVGWTIYFFAFAPSCTDRKLNGDEERVDCGGSCAPCLDATLREPVVVWTRLFSLGENTYDVASYVKNDNLKAGGTLTYTLSLLDASGALLAERKGSVVLLPQTATVLYAPALVSEQTPARATVTLSLPAWEYQQPEHIGVVSAGFTTSFDPVPSLAVKLRNQTYVESVPVEVTALLLDEAGNVYALSRTTRGSIAGGATDEAVFTWPRNAFTETPARVEVLVREAK